MSKGPSAFGFVGCPLRSPADQGGAAHSHGARREVVVNGTRVRTVDIHAHCAVPAAMAVLGMEVGNGALLMEDLETRLTAMDAQGLDMAALSINPYWYGAGRDAAAELIRIQNEKLFEIRETTPDRFTAFATIALQHPELRQSRSTTRLRRKVFAASVLEAASRGWNSPIQNSIRSGLNAKSTIC